MKRILQLIFALLLPLYFSCSSASVRKSGCIEGNCWRGNGTYLYPSGNKYTGLFRNGKPHGMGTMYYHNGVVLKGKWRWGKPDIR